MNAKDKFKLTKPTATEQKINDLEAQAKRLKAKLEKERTQRLILVGSAVLNSVASGQNAKWLIGVLKNHLSERDFKKISVLIDELKDLDVQYQSQGQGQGQGQ